MPEGLPTENDMSAAAQMFGIGEDQFCSKRIAHEVARQKRVSSEQSVSISDVMRCLEGDKLGQNIGMIAEQNRQGGVLTEIHTMVLQNSTTKTHRPSDALEKNNKTLNMIVGGILMAVFAINIWIALL